VAHIYGFFVRPSSLFSELTDYAFGAVKSNYCHLLAQKIVLGGVEIDGVKQMEWLKCAYKLGTTSIYP
jgi:hypothetical protein